MRSCRRTASRVCASDSASGSTSGISPRVIHPGLTRTGEKSASRAILGWWCARLVDEPGGNVYSKGGGTGGSFCFLGACPVNVESPSEEGGRHADRAEPHRQLVPGMGLATVCTRTPMGGVWSMRHGLSKGSAHGVLARHRVGPRGSRSYVSGSIRRPWLSRIGLRLSNAPRSGSVSSGHPSCRDRRRSAPRGWPRVGERATGMSAVE